MFLFCSFIFLRVSFGRSSSDYAASAWHCWQETTSTRAIHLLSKINILRNTTVIVATHNQVIVDDIRKRVIEMNNGKIVRDQQLGTYNK